MRAAWWWIDRWRKSTAYTDMSAEAQGVYRNLLDELWLRDGVIPADNRILSKISSDAAAWKRCRKEVLAHFVLTPAGYRNTTHDEIQAQSERKAKNQRAYLERLAAGHMTDHVTDHVAAPPSPSPSPSSGLHLTSIPIPGGVAAQNGYRTDSEGRPFDIGNMAEKFGAKSARIVGRPVHKGTSK